MKDCKNIRNKLSAFMDNELPIDEAFKLKQHLATCADCEKVFEEMRSVWNLIDKVDDIEPSSDFWHVLHSKLIFQRKTLFVKFNEVIQSVLYKIGNLFGIPLKPATIHTFSLDVFNDFPPESFGQLIYLFSPDRVK